MVFLMVSGGRDMPERTSHTMNLKALVLDTGMKYCRRVAMQERITVTSGNIAVSIGASRGTPSMKHYTTFCIF